MFELSDFCLMMKSLKDVYVALGGNIGNVALVLRQALASLKSFPGIFDLKISRFYKTTPVSDLVQDPYINAVCFFKTDYAPSKLLEILQQIEVDFGKVAKAKNEPRRIDLDILFFGKELIEEERLDIPHPRWQERLFVLIPLSDLAEEIEVPEGNKIVKKNINSLLKEFSNINNEEVVLYADS